MDFCSFKQCHSVITQCDSVVKPHQRSSSNGGLGSSTCFKLGLIVDAGFMNSGKFKLGL